MTRLSIRHSRALRIALPAALAVAGIGLTAPLVAQDAPLPGVADVARVTAGSYVTDPAHTLVGWRVDHFGFNDYFGIFGSVTGTLDIDPAVPESAKLDVTIPITSLSLASEGLKEHLLRPGKDGAAPDFFGADPAPARFVSTSVTRTGPDRATIVGNLTLNGQTKPIAIAARFTGAGSNPMTKAETIGFEGRAMLKRSDFGIGFLVPMVSDAVVLDISVAFERK